MSAGARLAIVKPIPGVGGVAPGVTKLILAVTSLETRGVELQPAVTEPATPVMGFALVVAPPMPRSVSLVVAVVSLLAARAGCMLAFVSLLTAIMNFVLAGAWLVLASSSPVAHVATRPLAGVRLTLAILKRMTVRLCLSPRFPRPTTAGTKLTTATA
jgi:hypothetical protein